MFLDFTRACRAVVAVALLSASAALFAAPAGQVEFAQGLASAQQKGQAPRFLSKGDALQEGDVVNTGAKGFAIVVFPDGTKMTLRPNTTFAIDQYNATAGQEAMALRLIKGGLRAITGAIGRTKPEAVRINTATSTVGIRGTSFDARICDSDCAREERGGAKPKPPAAGDTVVARVAVISGSVSAVAGKQSRVLVKGAPLYSGESIRTERSSHVMIVFRDETRITIASESEFQLENVRLTGDKADSGNFAVRLVKGTARAFTGLFAKRDARAFQFSAASSTIGIRGTGFDVRVAQECVAAKCADFVYTQLWDGSISLDAANQSLLIPLNRSAVFNALQNTVALLDQTPVFFIKETAPRPDQVKVEEDYFAARDLSGTPAGLYVNVRDGHVVLIGRSSRAVDLGRGEAGFLADGSDVPSRLTRVPLFLSNDPIPAPENFDERLLRLLEILGDSSGGPICEM